jgi:hypothetical protein
MGVEAVARLLRGLADIVDPPAPPPMIDDVGSERLNTPRPNRSGVALSLLDDECLGFFMLQVRAGDPPYVGVSGDVGEEFWQATGVTLHEVARAYGVRY